MSNANNDSKDGFMDRLAKKLFASPDSPFTAFADQQRMDRLEQCQQLQRILAACQSANNDARDAPMNETEEILDIPQSRSGARIARFFKWDSPNSDEQNDAQEQSTSVLSEAASSFYKGSDNDDVGECESVQSKKSIARRSCYSKDCAIETHELWACRALALGCGNHLGDLRRCLDDANPVLVRNSGGDEVEYYIDEKKKKNSCREIQVDMARCVNRHAAELDERNKAAKAAAATKQ